MTHENELRRIQDVADEVGLTTRAIRYYEEMGLLTPAARTEGSHRLYDATDVERLRSIQALRDDAGFSVHDIARMLEDQDHLARARTAFASAQGPLERLRIAQEGLARVDRQVGLLTTKIERLQAMLDDATARRTRIMARIDQLTAEAAEAGEPELAPVRG